MASGVSYSGDDLKALIGELYMECRIRAQREDTLRKRIAELEAENGRLRTDLEFAET